MTHPMAVEELQDDAAVEELAGTEIAVPLFAVIQHNYEEARARIHDLGCSPSHAALNETDPHPGTERIDMRLVNPPAAGETTPPTAAMSVAAALLAEQPGIERAGSPVPAGGPRSEEHPRSFPRQPGERARHFCSEVQAATAVVLTMISSWLPGSAASSPPRRSA